MVNKSVAPRDQAMKNEYQEAFREAVEANNLSYSDLVRICSTPERTVFKWLGGESMPDRFAIVMLRMALYQAGMKVPRSLVRIDARLKGPARRWAQSHHTGQKPENVGARINRVLYRYHGAVLNLFQISKLSGIHYTTCRARIKKHRAAPGSSVTTIINKAKYAR